MQLSKLQQSTFQIDLLQLYKCINKSKIHMVKQWKEIQVNLVNNNIKRVVIYLHKYLKNIVY